MRKTLLVLSLIFSLSTFSQQPGDLISVEKKMDDSAPQVLQRMAGFGNIKLPTAVAKLFQFLVKGLEGYKVTYWTTDHHDKLVKAHGLVMFPKVDYPLSTVLLEHPTADKRVNVPSNLKSTREGGFILDMLYALNGYYVVSPDYLGLGDSEGVHPYADAKTEASASIDMLTAADKFLNEKGVKRYNEYFLSGYSQGGHSTMAVLKYNTEKYKRFKFKQVYAGAGPYDLSKTTYEDRVLANEDYPSSAFIAYIVNGAHSLGYKQYQTNFTEMISPEFQETYKKHVLEEEGGLDWGPLKWKTLFTKQYINIASSPSNPLRDFLKKSDVYDFHNTTPTTMSYTTADAEIPFLNALKTEKVQRGYYSFLDLSKYKITATNLGPFGHAGGVFPWLIASIAKFNSNRSGGLLNWGAMLSERTSQETTLEFNKSQLHPVIAAKNKNSNFEITNIYGFNENSASSRMSSKKLEDLKEGAYIVEMKHDNQIYKIAYAKENSIKVATKELVTENKEGSWTINRKGLENEDITIYIFDQKNNLVHTDNFNKNEDITIDYSKLNTDQYTLELVAPTISLNTEIVRKSMELKDQLTVLTENDQITLKSNKEFGDILITDVQGKILLQQTALNTKNFTNNLQKTNGVIITKVTYTNGDYETKKVIW
ncbi:lipase family protein [Flavobacterium oreochromis]|uniref:lipase family protein n=1 Tax=Flavobacterium oreochromis TaxID=2906078 RepID=UPI00385AC20B